MTPLTPARKLLLGVLGIGGIALVIDQFVLGPESGPSKAAAAETSAESLEIKPSERLRDADKASPDTMRSSRGTSTGGGERVAVRLASLRIADCGPSFEGDDDAFAPPAAWRSVIHTDKTPAKAANPKEDKPAEPKPEFRLTMIAKRGGEAFAAVINGKLLKLDESIDGYRLVAVSANGVAVDERDADAKPVLAVLEGPGGRIELGIEPNLKARGKE